MLPMKPTTPPKVYRITREDGFTGKDKYVRFWRGEGVLDLYAVHLEQPDWVQNVGGEYVQVTGVALSEYVAYWGRRGFKIEKIEAEEAATLRAKFDDERRKEEAVEIAKQKARQKAKTLDKESESQQMEIVAEANARQRLGIAGAPGATPAASTEGGDPTAETTAERDKPPHETGAMEPLMPPTDAIPPPDPIEPDAPEGK